MNFVVVFLITIDSYDYFLTLTNKFSKKNVINFETNHLHCDKINEFSIYNFNKKYLKYFIRNY